MKEDKDEKALSRKKYNLGQAGWEQTIEGKHGQTGRGSKEWKESEREKKWAYYEIPLKRQERA